jgi:hypothetical protein
MRWEVPHYVRAIACDRCGAALAVPVADRGLFTELPPDRWNSVRPVPDDPAGDGRDQEVRQRRRETALHHFDLAWRREREQYKFETGPTPGALLITAFWVTLCAANGLFVWWLTFIGPVQAIVGFGSVLIISVLMTLQRIYDQIRQWLQSRGFQRALTENRRRRSALLAQLDDQSGSDPHRHS